MADTAAVPAADDVVETAAGRTEHPPGTLRSGGTGTNLGTFSTPGTGKWRAH